MKEEKEKKIKEIQKIGRQENTKNILILCIISIFICLPLLSNKVDIMRDDGVQHIARLMGTYQSFTEKQAFPVIMSQFCNRLWIFLEFIL